VVCFVPVPCHPASLKLEYVDPALLERFPSRRHCLEITGMCGTEDDAAHDDAPAHEQLVNLNVEVGEVP